MPRNASGVYTPPAGQPVVTNTTISASVFNSLVADISTALTGSVNVNGTAPMLAPLNLGNQNVIQLLDPTSPQMAATKAYVDAQGSLPAYYSASFRNRLVNGSMNTDQRNAGASGTATGYTIDRWAYTSTHASVGTWGQNLNAVAISPTNLANYLGYQVAASPYTVVAADYIAFQQFLEASSIYDCSFGTLNAQPLTLSFWVYSSLSGAFGGNIRNYASTRSLTFSYTIPTANLWTKIVVPIPADTGGTWTLPTGGPAGAMVVGFSLGTGATFTAPATNTWYSADYGAPPGATSVVGTANATFYLTGVQLEVAPVVTPFEIVPAFLDKLRCYRYYYSSPNTAQGSLFFSGNTTSGSQYFTTQALPTPMRASPSISLTPVGSPSGFANVSGTPSSSTAGIGEGRTANATVSGGAFASSFAVSAEL
jgi:hypothetical protein